MDNKSKLFLAFGLGALVGAAATALLTTEKGKALANDFSEGMKEKLKDLEKEFSDFLKKDQPKENPGV